MKKMTRIVAMMLTICLCFGLLPALTVSASAKTGFVANTLTREQLQTLVQQTALAYFYKGSAVQYDSYYLSEGNRYKSSTLRQTNNRDPEDASDLNPIYTVCSAFPHDIYYSIFGKHVLTNGMARPSTDLSNAGIDMSTYTPNDPINNYAEAMLNVTSEYTYHGAMAARNNPSWDLGNPDRDTDNYDASSPYADVIYYFGPEMMPSGKIVMTATLKGDGTQRVYTIKNDAATVADSINANAIDAGGASLALASTYTVMTDASGNPIMVKIKTGTTTEEQTVVDDEGNESTQTVEVDVFTNYYAVGFVDSDSGTTYYYISDADYTTGTNNPIENLDRAEVEKIFAEKLQPGDILVVRLAGSTDADDAAGGHAMMYLGDIDGDGVGEIIHSWGTKYNNDKARAQSSEKNYIKTGGYNNVGSNDTYYTYSGGTVNKYYYKDAFGGNAYGQVTAKTTTNNTGDYLQGYDLREAPKGWYSGTYTYGNNYNGASGTAFVGRNGGGSIIIEDWTTRLGYRTTFSNYYSKINANGGYGINSTSENYFRLRTSGNSGLYYPGGDGVGMTNKGFQFTVLRPLNRPDFISELSPSAQARRTLPDLGVTKTASLLPTWNVYNGSEITFNVELVGNKASGSVANGRTTTTISNFPSTIDSANTYTVTATEYLPAHTTFVSADNGGTYNASTGEITWSNISVADGATVNLQYTVQVSGAERGEKLVSPKGKVTSGTGYFSTSEISYIINGGLLSDAQRSFLKAPTGIAASGSGIDVANRIYQGAGVDLTLPSIDAMVDTLFEKEHWANESTAVSTKLRFRDPEDLTGDARTLREMVVNGYVGGKKVLTYDENGRKTNENRLRDLAVGFLRVGDILVYTNFNKTTGFYSGVTDGSDLANKVYVYVGNNVFACYDDNGTYQQFNGQTRLIQYSTGSLRFTYSPVVNQAFLYDCFFLLRPTQGVTNLKSVSCDLSGLEHDVAATLEESTDGGVTYGTPIEYGTLSAAISEEQRRTKAAAAAGNSLPTYRITLQSDTVIPSSVSGYGNFEIDLNGHTVTSTGKAAINFYGQATEHTNGVAYLKNGTIKGHYTAIYLGNQEELHIDGVNLYGADTDGTYWQPASLKFWGFGIAKAGGTKLYLNNTVVGTAGDEKPLFNGAVDAATNDKNIYIEDNVTFYTPKTVNDGHSGWDATGATMKNVSGVNVVTDEQTIALPGGAEREYDVLMFTTSEAAINGKMYESVEAAIAEAKSEDTITLYGNATITEDITVPAGVTLDVNGHTITGANVFVEPTGTYLGITVPSGLDEVSFGGFVSYDKFLVDPDMTVSQSLVLVDDIAIKTMVPSRDYSNYYAWVRWTDGKDVYHEEIRNGTANGGNYEFRLTGKYAFGMTERHALTIVGVDSSGNAHVAESKTISIQDYADTVLADYVDWTTEDDNLQAGKYGAKLGRTMVAMLEYGATAQQHFGYLTENLANANLTDEMKARITEKYGAGALATARSEHGSSYYGSNTTLFYGTSCVAGENMQMKYYFRLPHADWTDEEVNALTVQVSFTDHNGTLHSWAETGRELTKNTSADYRSYKITDLVAADITCPVTVTLLSGDTVLVSVWDSVANYTTRFKNLTSSGAAQSNLADSMMRYGLAARDYFGFVGHAPDMPVPEDGEFVIVPFTGNTYEKTTLNLKTDTSRYKTYGRSYLSDTGLVMLWPGNAIEFTADCKGDVTLNYTAEENGYLRTYVDGVEHLRPRITTGTGSVLVASDLPQGEHTIRIVRDSDISRTNLLITWNSVTLYGDKTKVAATPDKSMLIEYVGDSITVGKGVFSNGGTYTSDDPAHAATYAYSYLSAQALDADWRITARGGCGYLRTTENGGSCPKTMSQMYDYVNPFAADGDLIPYGFERKADLVVLALGTNDTASGDTFKQAVRDMIAQIRSKNGNVPIVLQYNMMISAHADELVAVAAEYDNVYSLKVTRNNGGGSSSATGTKHPSDAGQAVVAQELVAFLNTII